MGVALGWQRMHNSNPYILGQAWNDKVTRSGNTVSYSLNLSMKVGVASGYWDYLWYVDMQVGSHTSNNRKVKNSTAWHQVIGGKEFFQSTFNGNFTGTTTVSGKASSIRLRAQFHDSHGNRGPNVYWNVPIPTATSMDDIKKEVSGVGSDTASISARVTKTGNYSTITSWKLEYGVMNYSENVKTISGNNLSAHWLLENLLADTNYKYRITVVNSSGYSKQATGVFRTEEEVIGYKVTKGELIEPGVYEDGEASGEFVQIDNTYENEGQITSVEMLGNAEQDGTPTPDSPQAISVVTGENTVKVVGKNLANLPENTTLPTTTNPITVFDNGQDITVPSLAMTFILQDAIYTNPSGALIDFQKADGTHQYRTPPQIIDASNAQPPVNSAFSGTYYFRQTTSITFKKVNVYLGASYANWSQGTVSVQLELNTTDPTAYEPYQGQDFELNLGKNLTSLTGQSNITWGNTNNNFKNFLNTLGVGTYTFSCKFTLTSRNDQTDASRYGFYFAYGGGNIIDRPEWGNVPVGTTKDYSLTFTITEAQVGTFTNVYVYGCGISGATGSADASEFQVERGSSATSYSEYFTPLELAKIGTYQDRIYKDGEKWYIEKQVGKATYNGSETWYCVSSDNGYFQFNTPSMNVVPFDGNPATNALCDHFIPRSRWYVATGKVNGTINLNGSYCAIRYETYPPTAQGLADFKSWLSTHPTTVYYVLATPTTTEITNVELIAQLEALGVATLYVGMNNVLVATNNASPTLKIDYKLTVKEPVYDDRSDELVGWIIYPDGRKKKIKEIRRVYPT